MLFKEDGVFDETAALSNLIETYGQIEVSQTGEGGQKRKKADEKQPAETSEGAEIEKVKKPKASETVLVSRKRLRSNRSNSIHLASHAYSIVFSDAPRMKPIGE